MSIAKGQFDKGYIPNYGDEILEIDAIKRHMKPMRYKIRDAKGEKFKGFFYPEELTPVRRDADTTYRIERVFRKRKMPDGTMEVLVKFEIGQTPKQRTEKSTIEPVSPPQQLPPAVPSHSNVSKKRPRLHLE
ncbi:hypothetical protein niasHT_039460 [Heterodera trifolii]|uniref:Uncharacterized protein n=1 Tax=Heterodera trifolii TaxID=157864 RepID=A0ABD2IEC9_9BILA